MAILDTFYVLFKSDTSNLKKGAEEAQKIIGGLSKVLAAAIPAAFGIAGIKKAIDFGVELSQTSRKIGVNAQDLQAWSNAAELAGGNAKQFQDNLAHMAQRFGTSSETILKILPRYADILSRLSPQRAQQVGKFLGIDESTILLLQRGRREVDDMIRHQKELGSVTKEDSENFLKYQQSLGKVSQGFNRLNQVLAIAAVPILVKFFDILDVGITFFVVHKDLFIGGILGITIALGGLAIAFNILTFPVTAVGLLILGLIALFALVYEDIATFLKGGKSLVGFLLGKLEPAIKAVFNFMNKLLYGILHPIETVISLFTKLKNLIDDIFHGGKRTLEIGVNSAQKHVSVLSNPNSFLPPGINVGGGTTKSTSVTTGDIIINTDSNDPQKHADLLKSALASEVAQAINNISDGVTA